MQPWRQNLWFILEGNYCSVTRTKVQPTRESCKLMSLKKWGYQNRFNIHIALFSSNYFSESFVVFLFIYLFGGGGWEEVGGVLWHNTTIFHPNLEQEPKGTALNTTRTTAHWYTHWVCQLYTNFGAVRPHLLMLHWGHVISFGCSSAPKAPKTFTAHKEGGKICPKSQNPFFLLLLFFFTAICVLRRLRSQLVYPRKNL